MSYVLNSQNQNKIMAQVGAADWDDVVITYAGLEKEEVLDMLKELRPDANNSSLANLIIRELPGYINAKQAAQIADLSPASIRRRCLEDLSSAVKIEGSWHIRAEIARSFKRKRSHKGSELTTMPTPQLTQNQMTILNLLGADTWDAVVTAFAGLSKEQIFTRLSELDPLRDNMELMELIFREMPLYLDSFQVAEITGLAPVTIRKKCSSGQLQGAMKVNGKWMIPAATARALQRKPSRWDVYRRPETTIDGPVEHVQRTDSPPPRFNPRNSTSADNNGTW